MRLERQCRNPDCGKRRIPKINTVAFKRCGPCKTPYGPIALGFDRDLDQPTGLTQAEKDAQWAATLASYRKPAGGTR